MMASDVPAVAPPLEHPRYAQPVVGEHDIAALDRIIAPLLPDLSQKEINREDAAPLLDALAVRVARGRTAVDLAIGDVLAALAQGDRTFTLGYSNIGDYARERMGISPRTAQQMARLSRELAERPILAKAVRDGKVSPLRARIVAPVAHGEQEIFWTNLAASKKITVRHLKTRVREAEGNPLPTQQLWERLDLDMTVDERTLVEEALRLARKSANNNMPRWQCLEAICLEFLGSYPEYCGTLDVERARALMKRYVPEAETDAWQREYEWFTNHWDFLDPDPPTVAALPVESHRDPFELDKQLRELARMRTQWDALLGRLGFLIVHYGLWRNMMFTSFDHYCRERLGLGGAAMRRRARLEKQFWYIPGLRRALVHGRISYSKAALLARLPYTEMNEEIAWAETHTCLELQERVERDLEAYGADFLPSGCAGRNTVTKAFSCMEEARGHGLIEDDGTWRVVSSRGDKEEREDATGASDPEPRAANDGGEMFASEDASVTETEPPAEDGGEMFASSPEPAGQPTANPNVGFQLSLPESAITAVAEAIQAAQDMSETTGNRIGPGTALALIARHFIDICHAHRVSDRGKRDRIIERTGGRCAVPGCSRGSAQLHHVTYRSRGGADDTSNLVALCGGHHQRGVHAQRVRIYGNADRKVVFELGLKNGVPLETHRVRMRSAERRRKGPTTRATTRPATKARARTTAKATATATATRATATLAPPARPAHQPVHPIRVGPLGNTL